jgi:hypothetical protein
MKQEIKTTVPDTYSIETHSYLNLINLCLAFVLLNTETKLLISNLQELVQTLINFIRN